VVITAIANGSTAQAIGFQPGDIIVDVNNEKITKTSDLERISNSRNRSWRVTFRRGGQQISVMFSG
jgi:S1-C subfamily serine protease